jgi:hypothetical protein
MLLNGVSSLAVVSNKVILLLYVTFYLMNQSELKNGFINDPLAIHCHFLRESCAQCNWCMQKISIPC